MNLEPGEVIGGKYRIVRLIGDGGMGSVYEARHELLGAAVALKFLHKDLAQRPGLGARFLQEARVSATIESPHVTRVTDVDTAPGGSPYLVMELLHGESLQSLLDRERRLSLDRAIDFSLQILAGLEAAHTLGVVHRDLKPDNVFITKTAGGPLLKLIDFGIAKLRESSEYKKGLTRAGVVMGTPEYMAPEQLYAASEVDHRADIYSLGVMLFEMLSGARPADGDSAEEIVAKTLSGDVRRLGTLVPELPPELVSAVERSLSSDRERRFASAYEMRAALARFSGELSHAGRLAATPSPAATNARPALPASPDTAYAPPPSGHVPDTVDAPRQTGVPATLPPDDRPGGPKGATQAAAPPQTAAVAASPGKVRRRRRGRGPLLWLTLLGLAALAGVGLVLAQNLNTGSVTFPEALPQPTNGSAGSSVEPIVIPEPTNGSPFPGPATATPRETPTRPPSVTPAAPADAGAPSLFPGPLPFPSFALPSSLPPLPSGFPTGLPTSLPTAFPSILPQIPGLTAPPAPAPPDAGR